MADNEVVLFQPSTNPVTVLLEKDEFEKFYASILDEIKDFVPQISTAVGRKAIASLAFKVARTKTFLDDAGKQLNDEARVKINAVDASRRAMRERLDALKDQVREPLTRWEKKEEERMLLVEKAFSSFKDANLIYHHETVEMIEARLKRVKQTLIDPEIFQERTEEAIRLLVSAKTALEQAIIRTKEAEAERKELARLRAETADREQEERQRLAAAAEGERIRRVAEEAQKKIDTEAKRKAEAAILLMEEAHRKELAATQRRAEELAAAEKKRRDELASQAEAQKQRDTDRQIRESVIAEVRAAIQNAGGGIKTQAAHAIVLAIIADEIPHVTLRF